MLHGIFLSAAAHHWKGFLLQQTGIDAESTRRVLGTRSSIWDVSIKFLPSELREAHRRGGRKNVRARKEGGHQKNKAL